MNEPQKIIGPKVAVLAKTKGLTQSFIAQKCTVSRITIHRFFKGETDLKATDLACLLKLLGIDLQTQLESALSGRTIFSQPQGEKVTLPFALGLKQRVV